MPGLKNLLSPYEKTLLQYFFILQEINMQIRKYAENITRFEICFGCFFSEIFRLIGAKRKKYEALAKVLSGPILRLLWAQLLHGHSL